MAGHAAKPRGTAPFFLSIGSVYSSKTMFRYMIQLEVWQGVDAL